MEPLLSGGLEKVVEQMLQPIYKILRKDYTITVVGHSLGGALAVFASQCLLQDGYKYSFSL
jgi:triacylglycerol esterase/lipase EstA (alpha/beta hydrolase family)